jgi:hypothetical protein
MQCLPYSRAHQTVRLVSLVAAIAIFVPLIPPAAHAETLNAVADAYTRADKASANFGTRGYLLVKRWQDMRTFAKFDLGSVSSVDSATLRIPVDDVRGAGTITVHRVLESWDESRINHSNQPQTGPALASFSLGDSDSGKTVAVNATALARDLVANRSQNYGIVLKTSSAKVHLKSRESGSPIQLVTDGSSGGGDGDDGGGSGGGSGGSGSSGSLPSVADAYTRADRAGSNFGTRGVLLSKRWQDMRTFARFDLGSVSSVDSATLRIPIDDVKRSGTVTIHRVLDAWDERRITYSNQPRTGSALASFSVNDSLDGKTIVVDVTRLARDLVANRSQNFGIALRTSNAAAHFKSRESGTPLRLEINGDSSDGGGSNQPPSISGTPPGSVSAGSSYDFRPDVSDPDGDSTSCSVSNKPAWASFSSSSCRLFGSPVERDIGVHAQISITVSDGKSTSTLGPFEIEVTEAATGGVTLSWDIPTRNTDGSALTDLDGFRIDWDRRNSTANGSIRVTNKSVSSYVVENLSPGTYDFTVVAVNTAGVASAPSNSVTVTVN